MILFIGEEAYVTKRYDIKDVFKANLVIVLEDNGNGFRVAKNRWDECEYGKYCIPKTLLKAYIEQFRDNYGDCDIKFVKVKPRPLLAFTF